MTETVEELSDSEKGLRLLIELETFINSVKDHLGSSRERSLVVTHLEEAGHWLRDIREKKQLNNFYGESTEKVQFFADGQVDTGQGKLGQVDTG